MNIRRTAGFIAAVAWLLMAPQPAAGGGNTLEEGRVDEHRTTGSGVSIETPDGADACVADSVNILTEGLLTFTPKPEISICFCGSYYLEGEDGFKNYYLVNEEIDLELFVGKKVRVVGHPFSGICQGTLARPCDYLSVRDICGVSALGDSSSTWSHIKMFYR
jgi:hypothetical protein